MPKFSIAFIVPVGTHRLKHRIIESSDQDSALRKFFKEEIVDFYSDDEQGYFYFKEDFLDTDPTGSIINCD